MPTIPSTHPGAHARRIHAHAPLTSIPCPFPFEETGTAGHVHLTRPVMLDLTPALYPATPEPAPAPYLTLTVDALDSDGYEERRTAEVPLDRDTATRLALALLDALTNQAGLAHDLHNAPAWPPPLDTPTPGPGATEAARDAAEADRVADRLALAATLTGRAAAIADLAWQEDTCRTLEAFAVDLAAEAGEARSVAGDAHREYAAVAAEETAARFDAGARA